jgi:hypothetical protein
MQEEGNTANSMGVVLDHFFLIVQQHVIGTELDLIHELCCGFLGNLEVLKTVPDIMQSAGMWVGGRADVNKIKERNAKKQSLT